MKLTLHKSFQTYKISQKLIFERSRYFQLNNNIFNPRTIVLDNYVQTLNIVNIHKLCLMWQSYPISQLRLGKTNYCIHPSNEKSWWKIIYFKSFHNKIAFNYLLTPTAKKYKWEFYELSKQVKEESGSLWTKILGGYNDSIVLRGDLSN